MEEIKKVLLLVLGCAVQVGLGRWVERAALVFALRGRRPRFGDVGGKLLSAQWDRRSKGSCERRDGILGSNHF